MSLDIKCGEKVAIIGPSGCGKSTLLRLIMGLQRPDSGSIWMDGQDITHMDEEGLQQVRLKCTMLFQSGALFDSMNVADNVAFIPRENLGLSEDKVQQIVKEKLAMVEMGGTEHHMPSDLSGGMKKRIGLARAIAGDPEIVLYDEPTTGLDPILSTNIEDLIVKLNTQLKITTVVVTHQLSTIFRTADKIYLMHEGRLLPPETPSSITSSANPYVQYFIRGGLSGHAQ